MCIYMYIYIYTHTHIPPADYGGPLQRHRLAVYTQVTAETEACSIHTSHCRDRGLQCTHESLQRKRPAVYTWVTAETEACSVHTSHCRERGLQCTHGSLQRQRSAVYTWVTAETDLQPNSCWSDFHHTDSPAVT